MKSQFRPIALYFITTYAASVLTLWQQAGFLALAWGLLIEIAFVFPVALPAFTWLFLKHKGSIPSAGRIAWAFGSMFFFLSMAMFVQSRNIPAALFFGLVTYGYPGLLVFWVQRKLQS